MITRSKIYYYSVISYDLFDKNFNFQEKPSLVLRASSSFTSNNFQKQFFFEILSQKQFFFKTKSPYFCHDLAFFNFFEVLLCFFMLQNFQEKLKASTFLVPIFSRKMSLSHFFVQFDLINFFLFSFLNNKIWF